MRLLAIVSALFFSGMVVSAPTTHLHNIVVFGDSLSDNGNLYEFMKHQLPPSPPFYKGRFSNGPVWIEHLIASYFPNSKNPDAHLQNYAYGGAGVSSDESDDEVLFTLRREINTYFLAQHNKADPDNLYVLWIGANNYLALPEDEDQVVSEVNEGIVDALERLVQSGAKHIMVVNIPDLGKTPAATEFEAVDALTYLSKAHNNLLLSNFTQLKQKYADIQWIFFDMNAAFGAVIDNPQQYGFTNITDPCLTFLDDEDMDKPTALKIASLTPVAKDACSGALFVDPVHPTRDAHEILAKKVRSLLDEEGIIISE